MIYISYALGIFRFLVMLVVFLAAIKYLMKK